MALLLDRLHERLFPNLALAVRTFRQCLENVIRFASQIAGFTVQNPIKRNLRVRIAVFAEFDQLCGLAHSLRADENDLLFFR